MTPIRAALVVIPFPVPVPAESIGCESASHDELRFPGTPAAYVPSRCWLEGDRFAGSATAYQLLALLREVPPQGTDQSAFSAPVGLFDETRGPFGGYFYIGTVTRAEVCAAVNEFFDARGPIHPWIGYQWRCVAPIQRLPLPQMR